MENQKFIEKILDKISEFGDGELEFETRDIEKLCKLALSQIKNIVDLPPVSDSEAAVCCCVNDVGTFKAKNGLEYCCACEKLIQQTDC